jgi:hypothetical protein
LNQRPFTNNNDGGIFVGYINKDFGYGVISWNFVWEDEAHFEPHKYHILIYSWDWKCQCLRQAKEFTTSEKYQGWRAAFMSLVFPLENFIDKVIRGEHSTLGFEDSKD